MGVYIGQCFIIHPQEARHCPLARVSELIRLLLSFFYVLNNYHCFTECFDKHAESHSRSQPLSQ